MDTLLQTAAQDCDIQRNSETGSQANPEAILDSDREIQRNLQNGTQAAPECNSGRAGTNNGPGWKNQRISGNRLADGPRMQYWCAAGADCAQTEQPAQFAKQARRELQNAILGALMPMATQTANAIWRRESLRVAQGLSAALLDVSFRFARRGASRRDSGPVRWT